MICIVGFVSACSDKKSSDQYNISKLHYRGILGSFALNKTSNNLGAFVPSFGQALAASDQGDVIAVSASKSKFICHNQSNGVVNQIDFNPVPVLADIDFNPEADKDNKLRCTHIESNKEIGGVFVFHNFDLKRAFYFSGTSDSVDSDFGHAVALSRDGTRLAIGHTMHSQKIRNATCIGVLDPKTYQSCHQVAEVSDDGAESGAVFLYEFSNTWKLTHVIKPNLITGYRFGHQVEFSDDGMSLVVTSIRDNKARSETVSTTKEAEYKTLLTDRDVKTNADGVGAIYRYQFNNGDWQFKYYGSIANNASLGVQVVQANNTFVIRSAHNLYALVQDRLTQLVRFNDDHVIDDIAMSNERLAVGMTNMDGGCQHVVTQIEAMQKCFEAPQALPKAGGVMMYDWDNNEDSTVKITPVALFNAEEPKQNQAYGQRVSLSDHGTLLVSMQHDGACAGVFDHVAVCQKKNDKKLAHSGAVYAYQALELSGFIKSRYTVENGAFGEKGLYSVGKQHYILMDDYRLCTGYEPIANIQKVCPSLNINLDSLIPQFFVLQQE
jgi:hypothetical protein